MNSSNGCVYQLSPSSSGGAQFITQDVYFFSKKMKEGQGKNPCPSDYTTMR